MSNENLSKGLGDMVNGKSTAISGLSTSAYSAASWLTDMQPIIASVGTLIGIVVTLFMAYMSWRKHQSEMNKLKLEIVHLERRKN